MRKTFALAIMLLLLASMVFAAKKDSGSTTLKNVEPAGTTDKKHKKQQFDLTFSGSTDDFTCRTNENEKVNATDWVVGTSITFSVNGNKGEVKNTSSGKKVKCTVVRVAALTPPPQ